MQTRKLNGIIHYLVYEKETHSGVKTTGICVQLIHICGERLSSTNYNGNLAYIEAINAIEYPMLSEIHTSDTKSVRTLYATTNLERVRIKYDMLINK